MHKQMANDRGVNKHITADWFLQDKGYQLANGNYRSVEKTFVGEERVTSPKSVCVGGQGFRGLKRD